MTTCQGGGGPILLSASSAHKQSSTKLHAMQTLTDLEWQVYFDGSISHIMRRVSVCTISLCLG